MKAGLVSVTFRGLSPDEIVDLAARCGLEGIEWGGDIHVPCGDLENARRVGEYTRSKGLEVVCYGSYCRMTDEDDYEVLVETAKALGAPLIRVWAGMKGSCESSKSDRADICRNARKLAGIAREAGIDVAFEYHGGTLTDSAESALALLEDIDRENVGCLWQPTVGVSTMERLQAIRTVSEYVRNIHVFSWDDRPERYPLSAGAEKWRAYLDEISKIPGGRWLLLEFVKDDAPEQLIEDARCLKNWMEGRWEE